MKISCHQPYWFPYAGHFRLFACSDLHVFRDDVQFIKGGWIHRNKVAGEWIRIPIRHPKSTTLIKDMEWLEPRASDPVSAVIAGLWMVCRLLDIPFNAVRASHYGNFSKGQAGVLEICQRFGATQYINAPGGRNLYQPEAFNEKDVWLHFLTEYPDKRSILECIADDGIEKTRKAIYGNLSFS